MARVSSCYTRILLTSVVGVLFIEPSLQGQAQDRFASRHSSPIVALESASHAPILAPTSTLDALSTLPSFRQAQPDLPEVEQALERHVQRLEGALSCNSVPRSKKSNNYEAAVEDMFNARARYEQQQELDVRSEQELEALNEIINHLDEVFGSDAYATSPMLASNLQKIEDLINTRFHLENAVRCATWYDEACLRNELRSLSSAFTAIHQEERSWSWFPFTNTRLTLAAWAVSGLNASLLLNISPLERAMAETSLAHQSVSNVEWDTQSKATATLKFRNLIDKLTQIDCLIAEHTTLTFRQIPRAAVHPTLKPGRELLLQYVRNWSAPLAN